MSDVRLVRLLRMDDPLHLEPEDRRRVSCAEAQARYRERHPDRVVKQNAAQYEANRAQRLMAARALRYGPRRMIFLERHRAANARWYAKKRASERDGARSFNQWEASRP